ncbi:protein of unknown function [Pseudodesulfovibrio profundus]|uniref:Uncharacterized protein n=1 Tax=Pseudodesulfovibrio profundus TaxID=57320 RepID=A0A2C8FBU9_9BACT|nr:protein of unknown function [Pseudodesulfovibrio profundus]
MENWVPLFSNGGKRVFALNSEDIQITSLIRQYLLQDELLIYTVERVDYR